MTQDRKAKMRKQFRNVWKHVLWLVPLYIIWFVLCVYPQLQVFPMSLYEWNPVTNAKEYVGLYYYKIMFDP